MTLRALLFLAPVALVGCTTFDDLTADPSKSSAAGVTTSDGGLCANPPCVVAPDGTVLGGGKGAGCKSGADCASTICQDNACTDPSATDGVKNGTETDVDCGGTAPTNAPKCLAAKACKIDDDCFWGKCGNGVCGDDIKGVKDGDQTDVDCGGTQSPACDWTQGCQFDRDCQGTVAGTNGTCGPDHTCLIGPSCAPVHGGSTCGTGEFDDQGKQHESCCNTLLVDGFSDSHHPGKLVYLDKYEITAGRMRAFIEEMAKENGGAPNVQAWMAKHRPTRWQPGWENLLPQDFDDGQATFTVSDPTADPLYPGEDKYLTNLTQTSWHDNSGTYTVDTGVYHQMGADHFFPEYSSDDPTEPDYAATHNLNCTNVEGSFGLSTYWFDAQTVQNVSGGVGKAYSQDVMDEKSLNCTPFGLFAAFCAWDGGELMTAEVFDEIAGGAWPTGTPSAPVNGTPPPNLAGDQAICGGNPHSLVITADGADDSCLDVYNFPDDNQTDYDGTNRIAAPGRIAADVISVGGKEWHDLKGNLLEAVLASDDTFDYRGYGVGYSSVQHHRNQESTPRMKGGSFGARCMRFRDTPAPGDKH